MLNVYLHYYNTVNMIIVDITVWEILPNKLYLCTDILLKHINLLLLVSFSYSFMVQISLLRNAPAPEYRENQGCSMAQLQNNMVFP